MTVRSPESAQRSARGRPTWPPPPITHRSRSKAVTATSGGLPGRGMRHILARSGLPGVPPLRREGANLAPAMRARVSSIGLAGVLSVALAVVVPAAMMIQLFPLTSDMPAWDQWTIVPIFEAHYSGRAVLPLLLAPYNRHYNCLPRFLMYRMGVLSRWD